MLYRHDDEWNKFEIFSSFVYRRLKLCWRINYYLIQIIFCRINPGISTIEIFILYDFYIFSFIKRKYLVYKKKLYVLIIFLMKYDYLCKHFYISAVVHIDHRFIIHFLKSDMHERIYGHWTNQLRRLNIEIRYISNLKNKIIDVLFRTIFDEKCIIIEFVKILQRNLIDQKPLWIWKNEKSDFEEFLSFFSDSFEVIKRGTLNEFSVFALNILTTIVNVSFQVFQAEVEVSPAESSWKETYKTFIWWKDVYSFLNGSLNNSTPTTIKKSFNFRLIDNILWTFHENAHFSCIFEKKVLKFLQYVHDQFEHWKKANILNKFRKIAFWSKQSQNVEFYIKDYLKCVRHESAIKSQFFHLIFVLFSFQLLNMNFIDPLIIIKSGNKFIFNIVCYFNKFVIFFVIKDVNLESVIMCLKFFFLIYKHSFAFYCNKNQHFDNIEFQEFLRIRRIIIDYNPSGSSKSIEMIEIFNKILKNVFKKDFTNNKWNEKLLAAVKSFNIKIILHLNISSISINFENVMENFQIIFILLHLFEKNITSWHNELNNSIIHIKFVRIYFVHRAEIHDVVYHRVREQQKKMIIKYNKKIRKHVHHQNDLIMLHQKNQKKLKSRWRGSFIVDIVGLRRITFFLKQMNERRIKGTFHDDSLKLFVSRTEYLAGPTSMILPVSQIIKKPKPSKRLKKD